MTKYHVDRRLREADETTCTSIVRFQTPVSNRPVVVAFVDASCRSGLTAAADTFDVICAESAFSALAEVRKHSASVLLVSPNLLQQETFDHVRRLIVKSLDVKIAAVVSEPTPSSVRGLLTLGSCGIRNYVDLGKREGWNHLRQLIDDSRNELARDILAALLPSRDHLTPGMFRFLDSVVRGCPRVRNIREFSKAEHIPPSTLMSRFFRARLPAPKSYLTMARLIYAAHYFERAGVSVADVSLRLSYSSPQAFNRHVRDTLGLTAGELQREIPMAKMLHHVSERLIEPYRETFTHFDPFNQSIRQRSDRES